MEDGAPTVASLRDLPRVFTKWHIFMILRLKSLLHYVYVTLKGESVVKQSHSAYTSYVPAGLPRIPVRANRTVSCICKLLWLHGEETANSFWPTDTYM